MKPFSRWRLLAQDVSIDGDAETWATFGVETKNGKTWDPSGHVPAIPPAEFDELVVHGLELHLERMDARVLWFRAGPATFNLVVERDGKVRLYLQDGEYDPAAREFRP